MNRLMKLTILAAAAALFACGGGDDSSPDAGGGGDAGANADAGAALCADFATPVATLSAYPANYSGDIASATADLAVAQSICTDERSFFSQAGVDEVIALTGLTAGTDYVVKINGAADMSFYIATSCAAGSTGPGAGECMLFVDEAGGAEVGDFTAPAGGSVFLVVDTFDMDAPTDGTYTVDVFEAECTENADCTDAVKDKCDNRVCVQCATDFDCTETTAPACNPTTGLCTTFETCTGDDASPPEHGDDGPTGAVTLSPTAGTPFVATAKICSDPASESDYYKITVAEGDIRVFTLDWVGDADLDLYMYDATGTFITSQFFSQPEVIVTEELTAGDYYIRVAKYDDAPVTAAYGYTLTASVPECETHFDCLEPTAPVCGASLTCVAGPSTCTGDDASENNDDGPAGATVLAPAIDGTDTKAQKICNASGEADYFKVTVAAGDNLTVTVDWTDTAQDLDLSMTDATGKVTGLSFWKKPEVITLTNLPAGDHFIRVAKYAQNVELAAVDYSITVARSAGGCATVGDCASTYETQIFRGSCNVSGACEFIDGAGALGQDKLCDSPDDCTSGVCSYGVFQSAAETSICTVACTTDTECAGVTGTKCTTPYTNNFCKPECTMNTECGANTNGDTLDAGLPWDYLTCNTTTKACDL